MDREPCRTAFTVEVKGQELALHEPRLKHALGLGYAVAPVAADHMMNIHDTNYTGPSGDLAHVNAVYQVGPQPANDLGPEKMTIFYHEVNWMHFQDCAVICMFYPYDYSHLAEALSGVTGCDYAPADVLLVGEPRATACTLVQPPRGPHRGRRSFAETCDDGVPGRAAG